jgi:hypothetical protein
MVKGIRVFAKGNLAIRINQIKVDKVNCLIETATLERP